MKKNIKINNIVYFRCFKGCAEWKVSGEGSLFEATKPEGCECDKVNIEKVGEDFPEEDDLESNRGGFNLGWGNWGLGINWDRPQEMTNR